MAAKRKAPASRVNRDDWIQEKKRGGCLINVPQDELAFGRAVITAKAKLENDPKWNTIRMGDSCRATLQKRLATSFMQDAGISIAKERGPLSRDEMNNAQKCLPGFQLKVFSLSQLDQIWFKGSREDKVLHLYQENGNWKAITSMPAFVGAAYYCDPCDQPFWHAVDHRCKHRCPLCLADRPCQAGIKVFCKDCNRNFHNQKCFENHKEDKDYYKGNKKMKTNNCTRIKKCSTCGVVSQLKFEHKCGKTYCRVCRKPMPRDHKCYMQKLTVKKKMMTKGWIFFDFETTQNKLLHEDRQEYEHSVNCVIAQKICPSCKDEYPRICTSCGPQPAPFLGKKALKDFCSWLFNAKNKACVAFAHNASGFDSQFILKHLHKMGTKPSIIQRGNKILSLQVEGISIIDSLSFLPMPLSKLPKAFGLEELKKGHFPHFFNTLENMDYIGPIPDPQDYGRENFLEPKKAEFDKWYAQNNSKEFNMKEELVSYCVSDVTILREACIKFRDLCLSLSPVDPFEGSLTLPSYCQKFFRFKFLKEDKIPVIPHGGFRPKKKFSNIAVKWLDWVAQKENITIQHAAKGGEVKILNRFWVDGYEEASDTIFEFNGCPFHGCPQCFPDQTVFLPLCGLKASEAYKKTLDRENLLRGENNNLRVMWGCELKDEINANPAMKNFFENHPIVGALDPKDAFFGGRTNAIKLHHKCSPGEKVHYVDVCSLYPWVCKYGIFPIGDPSIIIDNFKPVKKSSMPYEGIIKCRVLAPRGLYHPVLPRRSGGKLVFPLCPQCADDENQTPCPHTDVERSWVGTFVTHELKKALEMNYQVIEIFEVCHFEKTSDLTNDPLFAKYIDCFVKLKAESSGWPRGAETDEQKDAFLREYMEAEGIELDRDNMIKNAAMRQIAKLMLNSFWGKFGQNDNLMRTEYFDDKKKYKDCANDPRNEVSSINLIGPDLMMVSYRKEDDFIEAQANINVIIAAYVTAQARLKLYTYLEALQERVLYFDTDSVIYLTRPQDNFDLPLGAKLGELTDELEDHGPGVFINEFVSGGPKHYGFQLSDPLISPVIKTKGLSLGIATVASAITFDVMKNAVIVFINERTNDPLKVQFHRIDRKSDRTVVTRQVTKSYRVVYTKRVLQADATSLPYGY